MKNKIFTLFLIIVFSLSLNTKAQLNDIQQSKIDSLFYEWNKPNHPGGVIGIMKEGKLLYLKGYGLASLEYLAPISTGTLFNIASVSKQFTSMGIVLLDIQGKLSVDDDVRKFLTYLPEFEETITIRHLLHHTSGMRSLHAMLELAGWRGDDSRTNEDLVRFMKDQKDLNFTPGAEYLYCNTGYILMAEIIEKVTEEEFTIWMYKNIFEPLGMVNSYIEDNYSRVVPNNATSYYGSDRNGFNRAVEYWGYVGSGNMHSSVNDLLVWQTNFYQPKPGWKKAFEKLQTPGILNNGDTIVYAFGINIDSYQNEKRIQHGGSIGGYRSFICTYPEQKLNIVLLTNFSSSSTGPKVNEVTNILFGIEESSATSDIGSTPMKYIDLPKQVMEKYCGFYWNEPSNYSRKIHLKNDTLRYYRTEESESILLPVSQNEFQMIGVDGKIIVSFEQSDLDKVMLVQIEQEKPIKSVYYEPVNITPELLEKYTGKYYSQELQTYYSISVVEDKLVGYHTRHGAFGIEILRKDDLQSDPGTFGIIKIKRDKSGNVSGFYVTNGRVRNLWFEKIE